MTAEAERIAHGVADLFLHRSSDRVVQIAFLSWLCGSHCLMNKTVLNGLHTGDKFYSAGCAEKMSDHRFCGIYDHLLCRGSERRMDRSRLKKVVVVGAGSVSVDVLDLFRFCSRFSMASVIALAAPLPSSMGEVI